MSTCVCIIGHILMHISLCMCICKYFLYVYDTYKQKYYIIFYYHKNFYYNSFHNNVSIKKKLCETTLLYQV